MTKRELFTATIELINASEMAEDKKAEMVKGYEHEIEMLNKKAASKSDKPTATQVENEGYKTEILRVLGEATEPLTIKGIKAKSEVLGALEGSQKISSLLTLLKKADLVERTEIKKVAHFALVANEQADAE